MWITKFILVKSGCYTLKEEELPAPTIAVPPEEEEVPAAPLVVMPPEGMGCIVPIPALVSSSPFFFSQRPRRFFSPFFS
jgi:hypothetical protein